MPEITRDALTGIRLLICMAKADGVLRSEERFQLEDALAGLALPDGLTIATLLAEKNEAATLAKQVTSVEARDSIYASVFAMAHADLEIAEPEARMLGLLREAWSIKPEEEKHLAHALDAVHEATHETPASVHGAVSEKDRDAVFQRTLLRYSLLTGLTGAIPVPLVPSLLVVPLQVKMVHSIAGILGQRTDKNTVQLMFETLGVGTGCQLGIIELCKLIPGLGSLIGATGSFASTYGLGKVTYIYFQSNGKRSLESLKPVYLEERARGKVEFEKHKAALTEAHQHHDDEIRKLAFDLQEGRITPHEYEEKMDLL
jgi:uncharacterized protein (DUF697 family)